MKQSNKKTNRQVEIFLFQHQHNETLFLVLKRNPSKGGFWQPVTGGVHEQETDEQAAVREVHEETGVLATGLVDTEYIFTYKHQEKTISEHVFGLEVRADTKIILSPEHTDLAWVTKQEALEKYLRWEENKRGLRKLIAII